MVGRLPSAVMDSSVTVAVEIPLAGDPRHKNWAKIVDSVDHAKTSGWAYSGAFVAAGGIQDVPVGAVLLVYGERGSRANPQIEARVYTVNGDATLTPEATASGRAWARTVRDVVERCLGAEAARDGPNLSAVADHYLVAELEARGWEVSGGEGPQAGVTT